MRALTTLKPTHLFYVLKTYKYLQVPTSTYPKCTTTYKYLAYTILMGYQIHSMDLDTTFLQALLDEDI